MASNKTANYGLSQWEATDQVVRGDFNSDNAKLDAAIKGAEAKADNAQETADSAKTLAESAYCPDNLPFVVGTYTGKGAANGATQTINLGFKPSVVFAQCVKQDSNSINAVVATQGVAYMGGNDVLFQLTDTGFIAGYHIFGGNYMGAPNMNYQGSTYVYVAFR